MIKNKTVIKKISISLLLVFFISAMATPISRCELGGEFLNPDFEVVGWNGSKYVPADITFGGNTEAVNDTVFTPYSGIWCLKGDLVSTFSMKTATSSPYPAIPIEDISFWVNFQGSNPSYFKVTASVCNAEGVYQGYFELIYIYSSNFTNPNQWNEVVLSEYNTNEELLTTGNLAFNPDWGDVGGDVRQYFDLFSNDYEPEPTATPTPQITQPPQPSQPPIKTSLAQILPYITYAIIIAGFIAVSIVVAKARDNVSKR